MQCASTRPVTCCEAAGAGSTLRSCPANVLNEAGGCWKELHPGARHAG